MVKRTITFDPTSVVSDGMDSANIKVLFAILAQVKAITPVLYGQLRNSYMVVYNSGQQITERGLNDSGGDSTNEKLSVPTKSHTGAVGSNLEYAPYVEFGTRKKGSRPHLQPAVEIILKGASQDSAVSIIKMIQKENMKRFSK